MTTAQHATRIGILMTAAALYLGWVVHHSEPTFADGLRYIHQAERIEVDANHRALIEASDHPLHALGIAAMHRTALGGSDPLSWQRASLFFSFGCIVALVIPIYLLGCELFGACAAWLACLLVTINPIVADVVVNVLSECPFLVCWNMGLWAAIRYLRKRTWPWLLLVIALSSLAYLARPEGLLLPSALAATFLTALLFRATRNDGQTPWRGLVLLPIGVIVVVGPYIAMKGGLGTKPGIVRVLGLAPQAPPLALERGKPLPANQSSLKTYRVATVRMIKAFRVGATTLLFPFGLLGLFVASRQQRHARTRLFVSIVLAASAVALVRLHVTGGYCTARHGLIPGLLLTVYAANAISWLMARVTVSIGWIRSAKAGFRVGRIGSAGLTSIFLGLLIFENQHLGPRNPGPYSVYETAGRWLVEHARQDERILDLTGWPLYFSRRAGYTFADIYTAPTDPSTRWIVVRQPHIDGHWHYSQVVRDLIDGREPIALVPPRVTSGQVQIRIYDRHAPPHRVAINTAQSPTPLNRN